jgi:hypothetical protein
MQSLPPDFQSGSLFEHEVLLPAANAADRVGAARAMLSAAMPGSPDTLETEAASVAAASHGGGLSEVRRACWTVLAKAGSEQSDARVVDCEPTFAG